MTKKKLPEPLMKQKKLNKKIDRIDVQCWSISTTEKRDK